MHAWFACECLQQQNSILYAELINYTGHIYRVMNESVTKYNSVT